MPRNNNPVDFLSRNTLNDIESTHKSVIQKADEDINLIAQSAVSKALTQQEIKEATANDTILQKLMQNVKTKKWTKDPQLQLYFKIRNQLSIKNSLLFKEKCIVIPLSLQQHILNIAHSSHQGETKTKAILREKVWWVGMLSTVENLVKTCHRCQVTAQLQIKYDPLKMSEVPKNPWEVLAINFKGPFLTGEHLLVVIDYRSRYLVIAKLK